MKKAGIKRGKRKNFDLTKTKVSDWGISTISKIDKAIDLLYRKK
ncbi:hypothetical protein [Neobacillus drentensis]